MSNINDIFVTVDPTGTDWRGTCSVCGFDSVVRLSCVFLTTDGVSQIGTLKACVRCRDMASKREEG